MKRTTDFDRKRHINISLDQVALDRLKTISERLGNVSMSAAIRWCAAQYERDMTKEAA
jgi:division protein CdvB (Snf7/Vps24/ESCRT-III family)